MTLSRTLDILKQGADDGLHLGAQLYVSRQGDVLADEAIGEARPTVPMTTDKLMLWMSAGKPVTAIASLQCVKRGLISLDTRVAHVLPEFGVKGKEAITLRHLLTHTAGFRGPLNNYTPGTWEEILARVYALKQEPGWVPGQKAGYHIGSSWFVLGELIRRVDGRSIDRYVREEVFGRLGVEAYLGMSDAEYDALLPRFATMFDGSQGPMTDRWPGNARESATLPRPGANVRGPIRAMGKVYESILLDERLLSRSMCEQFGSRQRTGMFDHTFKQTLDWGFGVMIDSKQYAGEHQYGYGRHASERTFGHSGNQSSCAFCDPVHGLVVAWATNGMPGEVKHQERQRVINAAIYEDLNLS